VREQRGAGAASLLEPTNTHCADVVDWGLLRGPARSRPLSLGPIRSAHVDASHPKFFVEIENTGHFAYVDGWACPVYAELCIIRARPGCVVDPNCGLSPTTLTRQESHDAVLRWVVPFLEAKLAGDGRYESLLTAAPPGAVLHREP
jgi:hypothetical protein